MSHRSEKLAEAIKKEISDIINNQIKDPRIGFTAVTSVEVSGDLRYAKAFISVLGGKEQEDKSLVALDNAKGFIRSELGKRIRVRYIPEVSFKIDSSIETGSRIMKLLNEINQEDKKD